MRRQRSEEKRRDGADGFIRIRVPRRHLRETRYSIVHIGNWEPDPIANKAREVVGLSLHLAVPYAMSATSHFFANRKKKTVDFTSERTEDCSRFQVVILASHAVLVTGIVSQACLQMRRNSWLTCCGLRREGRRGRVLGIPTIRNKTLLVKFCLHFWGRVSRCTVQVRAVDAGQIPIFVTVQHSGTKSVPGESSLLAGTICVVLLCNSTVRRTEPTENGSIPNAVLQASTDDDGSRIQSSLQSAFRIVSEERQRNNGVEVRSGVREGGRRLPQRFEWD
eukprot:3740182-Rhodomonas_salina.1